MSIAQAQRIKDLEREILEVSRALTDMGAELHKFIREADARFNKIEQARKPGPKPKEAQ